MLLNEVTFHTIITNYNVVFSRHGFNKQNNWNTSLSLSGVLNDSLYWLQEEVSFIMNHIFPVHTQQKNLIFFNGLLLWTVNKYFILHSAMVKPHPLCPTLSSPIQEWHESSKKTMKMIKELDDMSYKERLRGLGLFNLEKRRLSVNLLSVFK